MREFVETGPYMAMVLNSDRQILFASRTLLDLIGGSELEHVVGLRLGEALNCIHAGTNPGGCGTSEFCRHCGAANATLAPQTGRRSAKECRITRRVGRWDESLDLLVCTSPIVVDGEQYVICNIADTSHEKRRHALERLFFHDLMNSAGNIQGLSQVLEEIVSDEGARWVELLSSSARQLIAEIDGQRQLLAAENGELVPNPVVIEVGPLLKNVAGIFATNAVASGRTVRIEPTTEKVNMTSDTGVTTPTTIAETSNAVRLNSSGTGSTSTL